MNKNKERFFKGWDIDWEKGKNTTTRIICWELHNLLELGDIYEQYLNMFRVNLRTQKHLLKYEDWKEFMNE